MAELKPWWSLFPQGTRDGDEESRFFCAISRHHEHRYRSIEKMAVETNLSEIRVEEIISKYAPLGVIVQNPKNPDMWGYWERIGLKEVEKDILEEEHDQRLKRIRP
jgi:hypothetical protein